MGRMEFKGISKVYPGGVQAVHDFNLSVDDGQFVVLVGPSGCGKSTVLRMIAGLESITEGQLLIDGKLVNKLPPVERDVSVVFQDYALYGNMSVYDNVGMSLRVRHKSQEEIFGKVMETSRFLEIQEYLNRYPEQLSGGQKQRVSLGRAIAREPKVYLMDEPLSNLDAMLRSHTRAEIVRIQKALGVTTVYVTHDQVEAMTMADKIVVMRKGVIQQVGTPLEIYQRPCNMFVAGFIGTPPMNFIPGVLQGDSLCGEGYTLPMPPAASGRLHHWQGCRIVVGVRPEQFHLDASSKAFPFSLEAYEFLGNCNHVFLRLGHLLVTAKLDRDVPMKVDALPLSIDWECAHFFDEKTTMRIGQGGGHEEK